MVDAVALRALGLRRVRIHIITLVVRFVTIHNSRQMRQPPKQQPESPFDIPPEVAARCTGPDQFEKFDAAMRKIIAVPKAEIDAAEKKWKRSQERKRAKKRA